MLMVVLELRRNGHCKGRGSLDKAASFIFCQEMLYLHS